MIIKQRIYLTGVAIVGISLVGVLGLGSAMGATTPATSPSDSESTPVASESWLQRGGAIASTSGSATTSAPEDHEQPQTFDVPKEEHSGALVDAVTTVAKSVIPSDAVNVFATSYPDLKAAAAGYSAGDLEYVVSIQKLEKPLDLADVIATEPEKADLATLDSGTQRLDVRGPENAYAQVILVGSSGISITVTVSQSIADGDAPALPEMLDSVTAALDVPSIATLLQEATK